MLRRASGACIEPANPIWILLSVRVEQVVARDGWVVNFSVSSSSAWSTLLRGAWTEAWIPLESTGEIDLVSWAFSDDFDSSTASRDVWNSQLSIDDSEEPGVVAGVATGMHSCPIAPVDSDTPTRPSSCNVSSFLGASIEAFKRGCSGRSSSSFPELRGLKIGASALNVTRW